MHLLHLLNEWLLANAKSRRASLAHVSSIVLFLSVLMWVCALQAIAGPVSIITSPNQNTSNPPNTSTAPNQPSVIPVSGPSNSTPNTTGAGNAANCSNNTGAPGCAGAGNPINVMTGNKYQQETDLPALPGKMGIEIVRHYNSLHMGLGQIGYGWRLSYETDLAVNARSIHITQADGSQLIFNRSVFNPSDCACQDPALGHVMIYHTAQGDEYTWFKTDGQQLHFNHMGKLERINAATGESVHLTRGLKGELLKVTDPQGRSLIMHYADKQKPGFKGIVAIDTPVGRFNYQHNNDLKSPGISNLTQVSYPSDAQATLDVNADSKPSSALTKIYHYGEAAYIDAHMLPANINRPQIPHAAHLLTGISASWQEHTAATSTSKTPHNPIRTERQRTWMYDQYGRGILSVHGTPKQLDKDGKPLAHTGLQQINVSYNIAPPLSKNGNHAKTVQTPTTPAYPRITHNGQLGQTIITNNLGQATIYNYTLVAGEYRLLQILGAGCSECAQPNIVYGYDKLGRQTDVTKVALLPSTQQASLSRKQDRAGEPVVANTPSYTALSTTHTDYDQSGRPIKISRIDYVNGQAQAPQLQVRYAYANTPVFPQRTQAKRAVREPVQVFNQPSLIAKPSVVKGREHQWHLTYNPFGQPTQITETGYRPALPSDQTEQALFIQRSTRYTYRQINGRSLLTQVDGALANGKTSTPQDSDITQYHYDQLGQYLNKIIAPNNVNTQLEYDSKGTPRAGSAAVGGTGRVTKRIGADGVAIKLTYANIGNNAGKILSTQRYPASLSLVAAKQAGLLQTTAMAYDVFGNTTMVKRADGQAVYMQYGTDGKLSQLRDALGNRVEWKDWNKGSAPDDSQSVSTQQWFTADAPDTVARAWYFWHDDQQRMTQRLSPDGGIDTWRYSDTQHPDTNKMLPQQTANNANWVQHIDPLNRMTLNAENSQSAAQIRITPAGYVDANFKMNTNSGNKNQTTGTSQPTQIADDFGRIIQFSSPQHGTRTAQYDAADHITHITQADGTQIDYGYDVAGRILAKTAIYLTRNSTKDTIKYAYNAFGLQQIQDAQQTITYSQDFLGRETDKLTTLKLASGKQANYHIRTRYNAHGHIKAKQLIDGQWLVLTLDDKTGLTKEMRLHQTIWPSLTNKLADWLDMPDLPLQIATRQTIVTDISVHPFNGISHLTHGNGISDNYNFDLAGRLTTVSYGNRLLHQKNLKSKQQPLNNKTGNPIIQASYTYDAGRRLVAETFTDNTNRRKVNQYAYTGWNQLTSAPRAGFIKAVATNSAAQTKAGNMQPAQLSFSDNASLLDQSGRTTGDANYRYHYNVWGKLSRVQTNNHNNAQTIATYHHNALGERVMASYPALTNNKATQTHYYLYDKQQRIAELDAQGNVTQQYLYINQTPVAVINTPSPLTRKRERAEGEGKRVSNIRNPTGIIAIHTDRRHAPIAATDEQGKVIWQTQYDAWARASTPSPFKGEGWGEGKVSPINNTVHDPDQAQQQNNEQNRFNLSLRLPGQWQDTATGLHYNYQRDYNPDTGRYLTPDPLGFPDGADPYAYVNNDPLNKIDPLGLYQIDMHYYMTLFLGVAAGLDPDVAKIIALAAQYIDDNPNTSPVDFNVNGEVDVYKSITTNQERLKYYHFMQDTLDTSNGASIHDIVQGNQLNNLYNAYLTANKNGCGKADMVFFGETLHALADTYSHATPSDTPYKGVDIFGNGTGHGLNDSDPDYTFNHYGYSVFVNKLFPNSQPNTNNGGTYWGTNADRTLAAEQAMFNQFSNQATWTKTNSVSFADLKDTLILFNQTGESEQYTFTWDENGVQTRVKHDETNHADINSINETFALKLGVLNSKLKELGFNVDLFDAQWAYNLSEAASNRQSNLGDLTCTDYPGVILPNGGPCQLPT